MKRFISVLLGMIFTLSLLFILLITSVEAVCYWTPGYFEAEYQKYDVLSQLPEMELEGDDGLMAVTDHMMRYLRGDEGYDELQIEVSMGGERRGFFSDREIAHMEDVRELFVVAQKLRIYGAALCVLCLLLILILQKGQGITGFIRSLSAGALLGTALLLLLLCGLGFLLINDFSNTFVTFHHIFFDNDLWILDPKVDMLINIVPEGFFYDTALRIAGLFAAGVLAVLLLGLVGWKISGKKTQKN